MRTLIIGLTTGALLFSGSLAAATPDRTPRFKVGNRAADFSFLGWSSDSRHFALRARHLTTGEVEGDLRTVSGDFRTLSKTTSADRLLLNELNDSWRR